MPAGPVLAARGAGAGLAPAPLQATGGLDCGAAARRLAALVRDSLAPFPAYVLLKIVLTLAIAAVMIVVFCLTCGCGLLPVVGQTVLQPAFFFERAWSLCLLRRLGHDAFAALEGPPLGPEAPPV